MLYKYSVVCLILTLLIGCQEDKDDFISMDEFGKTVQQTSGENATNCGKVSIDLSTYDVNTCVVDSFTLNIPFYAIYIRQGTDSSVASGVSMNSDGEVNYWHYDSDISGGSNGGSKVSSQICESPTIGDISNETNYRAIECQKN